MLSRKTAQEIGWMLDDYGIKHGPVVDSTRALYEKKLREAMAKVRIPKTPPGQTFYREEEEEDTYFHRRPLRHMDFRDRTDAFLRPKYEVVDSIYEPSVSMTQTPYRNRSQPTETKYESQHEAISEKSSGPFVPLWLQILLFLIVACILVFIFINMESVESEPFKRLT